MSELDRRAVLVALRDLSPEHLGWLSSGERATYDALPAIEKRRREWLGGRIAAKRAVQRATGLPVLRIAIVGEPGRPPRIELDGVRSALHLSISHSAGLAAAILSSTPIGIDLEQIEARDASFEALCFEAEEQRELEPFTGSARDERVTRGWCEKEALAKALGDGLRHAFHELRPSRASHRRTSGALVDRGLRYAWAISEVAR